MRTIALLTINSSKDVILALESPRQMMAKRNPCQSEKKYAKHSFYIKA